MRDMILRKHINLDNLFELILSNYDRIQYSLEEDISCDFDEYFENLKKLNNYDIRRN